MGMTSYTFDDLDWPYSFRETAPKSPTIHKSTPRTHATEKSWRAIHPTRDQNSFTFCTRNKCFTGILIALPLSLLAWGGILVLIASLFPD